ncbi:uncharacterized protein TNCV_3604991 [Trichonephila clavipes]|nr:uncharacterized protein TNCV_3604991 [Trichonephila clavipes]
MVDLLAKRGTDSLQTSTRDLLLHSAKLEISRIKKKCFRDTATSVAKNKSWRMLIKPNCISDSPRAAAVVEFRFLTGHLFRFNLTDSPFCVLLDGRFSSRRLACSLILVGRSYGELQVSITTKRTSSKETFLVAQDCSFYEGENYYEFHTELTCMLKLEPCQAKSIGTSFWDNMYVCFGVPWVQNLCLWMTMPFFTVQTSQANALHRRISPVWTGQHSHRI